MPELPEVETTRRQIAPLMVGRRVRELRTTADSYFFISPPAQIRRALPGRVVTALSTH